LKTTHSASQSLNLPLLALASVLVVGLAAPAYADKRHPAPIVYATGTSPYPAGTPQYIAPTKAPDAQTKKQARIQFRYPGTTAPAPATTMDYAGQGTAVTEPASRQYASIEAPAPTYNTTAGVTAQDSFDARAAAARMEAERQVSAVESEALPSLVATPMPEPAPVLPAPLPAAPTAQPQLAQPAVRNLTPAASYAVSGEPVPVFDETSVAIVYGPEFDGLPTANGETYNPNGMTAAHPTLPLPSLIQVVNTATGQEVVLRVNDRGPFEDGASLQVSPRAARELGMDGAGKATLRIRYLGAAPAVNIPAAPATPDPQMMAETTYQPVPQTAQQDDSADTFVPASYEPAPVQAQPLPQAQPAYTYSAPSPAGDFFVQIGSFTDIANAQTLSNSVQASLPVTIVPARVNGADYFRVRVGPLLNRDEAERAKQDLAYAGISQGRVVTGE
jgi:rare lipoprotein A